MRILCVLLALAVLMAIVPGAAGASVKAYYNGQEATVNNVTLQQGEPFTVDLYVTPDEESYAYAEIDEPGVTHAYGRIGGDDLLPSKGKPCNATSVAHYNWTMAASGSWVDGTAPLNVYYQINRRNGGDISVSGYFTVVDAYIIPSAPPPKPTASGEEVPATPWPGTIAVLAGIVAAALIRRTAS